MKQTLRMSQQLCQFEILQLI